MNEKTVEDYTSAIEYTNEDSDISMILVSRAAAYKSLNDFDNVWKDLAEAIERDPDNIQVYLDTIEEHITISNLDKGLEYIKKHEDRILENSSNRQRLIFLYLKAIILISLNMSIDGFREDINTLASEGMELMWNFSHTNVWLEESDFSQDKKQEITHLTDVLLGKQK